MNTGKNRYARRSHLSEAQFRRLVRLFAADLPASTIALLTGFSRRTVNHYVQALRERMAAVCEAQAPFRGEVEVDESYFGKRRVRGKRGRGAGGKTIVFGILERHGHVYTEIVPDVKKATLLPVIRGHVALESIMHTDEWKAYDGLVDLGYQKHFRVRHTANVFATPTCHINGIESFWGTAKTRLMKRRGIRAAYLYWHLKECEFRFNHRKENLYRILLALLRNDPLK
jgi:transposase